MSGNSVTRVGDVSTLDGGIVQSAAPSAVPLTATFITQTPSGDLSAEQALSALPTGILKSTTGTGVVSIATPGTDYAAFGHTHPLTEITDDGKLASVNTVDFLTAFFSVATPVAIT